MPLLHKKPFIKKKPNPSIKPTDKVFFCELTEEVFTDYDEFWERLVLLNALVWTCELTGRPNLTYHEALECEKKAKKCISNVSLALKKPLLYISTLTKRGRIIDTCDDIFVYIRDRYFVGEEVEAIVTKVIMPTKEQISDYQKSIDESDSDNDIQCITVNGKTENDDDDDEIFIVRDDHCKSSSVKSNPTNKLSEENEEYPPFPTVRYEVIEIEAWDYKEPKVHVVGWDQIRRSKSAFTREKCKLFVKQYMVLGHEGYWKIKDSIAKQFKIPDTKYNDIFVGNPPKFEESVLKKVPMQFQVVKKEKKPSSKTVKQREDKEKRDIKHENNKNEVDAKKKKKPIMTEEDREAARKFQLELKEKSKELIRKKLEQKKLETKFKKDVDKEMGRLMRIYEAEWWQKREDLECEDHKDLPKPHSFTCRIPMDNFGDFLMILDFVNSFANILELGDVYPDGITFEMLEQAFVTKEVAGVFNDVVQLLLGAIFSLQEEEDEEVEGDSNVDMASMNLEEHLESKCLINAVNVANKAATWSQQYQGLSLQKAPLDALTLSEILRLHILASGATNVANAFWRHVNRGGYKHTDDPGLQFKLDEPEIIKKLSTESLFDLAIEEKIKILTVLVSQILTYASVRDNIEEKVEKLRELSYNYKMYKFAIVRKEKEETNAKKQKIKDIKMKVEKKLFEQRMQGGTVDPQLDAEKAKIMMEELEEVEIEKETRATYKKREEAENKERDFIDQIETLTKEMKQFQLGQDRAFRRFWTFNTIPGLYVEDRNDNLGQCNDFPTPVRPVIYPKDNEELMEAIRAQAIRNVKIRNKEKEIEKNNSDKENENSFKTPTKTELKTPLLEKNSLQASNSNIVKPNIKNEESKEDTPSPKLDEEEEEIVDFVCLPEDEDENYHIENLKELHSKIFGLCSADPLTCPVHTLNHSRPKWAYYSTEEELGKLIENLNERGARESELKSNIILNKDKLLKSMQRMLSFSFETSQKDESQIDLKKCLKRNLNFPPDTPVDRILELTLRDMVLEIEEKIDNGMLGALKVPSRDAWRQGLVDGTTFLSNTHQDLDWGGKMRIKQFKSSLGMDTTEEDLVDSDEFVAKEGSSQAGVIKELSIAILQVAQALELKYLKDPLAESVKLQKKRKSLEERLISKYGNKKSETDGHHEASDEEEENHEVKSSNPLPKNIDNSLRTPFERWEKSLMACTSFSQLFLHLATLDDSITWKRSAVTKKRCRVCKRQNDPNSMLLCDGCDGGYHMSCLRPKLKSIPEGDWYCDKCKPKIKPKSPRKQRQVYNEEVEEEEEEDEGDEEMEDEEEDEDEGEEPEFINLEYCYACGLGGEIVLCDTCPKSFHLECVELRKIPRGNWSCPFCKDAALRQNSQSRVSINGNDDIQNKRNPKRSLEVMEDNVFHSEEVQKLIHKLMSHNDSGPFRKPIYRQDAPDYYEKIKKPMDLRTVKMRYNKNKYINDAEFIADVLLIFQNTQQYFDENSVEYKAGLKLSKYFLMKVRSSNLHSGGLIENEVQTTSKRKRHS
ncbi:Bromodomain adjacent to zinc finger domain protein 1A [Armadillidium nasatum]|uniref:Bromodomain adjacent to zinc finger domain protein 1A n=1 Tax=Armadillidium nasatum TaxID=96803 RepID=A0A5N5SJ37_9CRUS|nr:Bromodomain adjacent to zinc finger domain protein 1A [Armadillidium nasatum]